MNTDANPARTALLAGLWHNNPGLVQLLSICPLLAVSNSLINGLGLGAATLLVLTCTNTLVSALRQFIPHAVRLPAFVLIIAAFVTVTEQLCRAFFFDLYLALGIFLPLIVTNCTILARAEVCASRQPLPVALLDGLGQGAGFLMLLCTIGAIREVLGHGTLLAGAELLFGPQAAGWRLAISGGDGGITLAVLPAGAFFVLALLVAARNMLTRRTGMPR